MTTLILREARRTPKFKGWKPDKEDSRDLVWTPTMSAGQLPVGIDLESRAKFNGKRWPRPYDQSTLGSCITNSISGAIQYEQVKLVQRLSMPSRLFIYYMLRKLEGTIQEDAGGQIRNGMKAVNKFGFCTESAWPYIIEQFRTEPSKYSIKSALEHRVLSYQRVPVTLNKVRMALAEDYPVVGGFCVYSSYFNAIAETTGLVKMPRSSKNPLGGHAVLFVGYDDTTQLLKFRNSYGPSWGDRGYGYLPYDYIDTANKLADDFWILKAKDEA